MTLREGQQAEAGLAACGWIGQAGARLGRGFVLTVDYGHEAAELYNERHQRGTVLAYARHPVSEDLLRAPGEQDLTAHVSFTALEQCGRRAGLERTGLRDAAGVSDGHGTRRTSLRICTSRARAKWRRLRGRLLLKTLIHPEGMGETFRVFVQHKGIEAPVLTGLAGF